ncbi:oligosaccharide flippase family protein [Vibrio sp. L5-1]|uniref:lipopolysaccharide biosynthesis protein n=1 Tax=Vibrio sp. L5-1 TaxID=2912254 RepID=UPI001F19C7FD|nr:oligosaccharide flippase family protein [Vibrio sp. L5-1]MCF7497153.1 oligosaccharide flippase family protein [Vibrio sp. L5-1]
MSKLKKDLSITFLGSIVSAVCNIIWLALISREYGVEKYGIYIICQNLGVFIATFASIRTGDLIYKNHKEKSLYNFIKLFSFILTMAVSTFVFVICYSIIDYVSGSLYSEIPRGMILLSFIYILLFSFNNYSLAILRCEGKFNTLVKIESTFKIVQLLTGVVLLNFTSLLSKVEFIFYIWFGFNSILQIVLIIFATRGVFKKSSFYNLKINYFAHKDKILNILFHSNLLGYFKIATSPGDTFLIGLFAGAHQVAVYNVALQVINIGVLVKNNLSNVLTAKVIQLYSDSISNLKTFVSKYIAVTSMLSVLFIFFIWLLGKPILDLFFGTQPNEISLLLLIMSLNYVVTLVSLCYYPIALSVGDLKSRTILLTVKILFLVSYIFLFELSAIAFVIIELVFSILIRLINDYPLHKKVFHA